MNTPQQYRQLWDSMNPLAAQIRRVLFIRNTITAHQSRYESVVKGWAVPWFVVGAIHNMESDMSFTRHLHNGDPLTARTTHVSAGRPVAGNPPFTWEESAVDALKLRGIDRIGDWSIPHMLLVVEGYNGYGYARKGINSPYLWAGSNQYGTAPNIGKYVEDGKFDPTAVSNQIGAAVILRQFIHS